MYLRSKLVGVELFDLSRNLLLCGFPLLGLVESQTTMRQIASSTSTFVSWCTYFATGVIQLSEK